MDNLNHIGYINISFLQKYLKDTFKGSLKCDGSLKHTEKFITESFDKEVGKALINYLSHVDAICDCKVMNLKEFINLPSSELVFKKNR